jgi:tetratricopeptide (TPR) repeat protein
MTAEHERNMAFPTKLAAQRGFEANPEMQRAVLRRGVVLLEKSIASFPLDSTAHHMLGDTYLRLGHMENALPLLERSIEKLKRAVELNPLSPYSYQSLASAYWAVGNATGKADFFQKALSAEEQAARNFPVNPDYQQKLAQICTALGLSDEAEKHRELARELQKHYKEF